MKDALLTIRGAKFKAALVNEDIAELRELEESTNEPAEDLRAKYVDPETIDSASKRSIQKQGGLGAYIQRQGEINSLVNCGCSLLTIVSLQVNMAVDMLTLCMEQFELCIDLPSPEETISSATEGGSSLVIKVSGIELLSLGRDGASTNDVTVKSKLKQRIKLDELSCAVLVRGLGSEFTRHSMIDPFSYTADVLRIGDRFGGFLTGVQCFGLVGAPEDGLKDQGGLSFHIGHVQVRAMTQLGAMCLAPVEDGSSSPPPRHGSSASDADDCVSDQIDNDEPSSFVLPLSYISLVLLDTKKFRVSNIGFCYRADGTVCSFQAAKMVYEGNEGEAYASDVFLTARPVPKMTIGIIESLQIKDTFLLATPIESSEYKYEGKTLSVSLDSFDIVLLGKEDEAPADDEPKPLVKAPYLPCNIALDVHKDLKIKSSLDGSMMKFTCIQLYALADGETKIAVQFQKFQNHLVSLSKVNMAGTIPHNKVDVIEDFVFSSDGTIDIVRGHSTNEWADAFRPASRQKINKKAPDSSPTTVRLPNCNIAQIKVVIRLDTTLVGVNDTKLAIKPYKGNPNTTVYDVTNNYVKSCLSHAPDFISNAEVLGLNVLDSGAKYCSNQTTPPWLYLLSSRASFTASGLLGTWTALPVLGSAFGAGAGVVAVTAVDAVRGAVDAGKRSRNDDEHSEYRPGDFTRGLIQAAAEATQKGAKMRGKQGGQGNVIDWAVGATSNNAEYISGNKARLGAAGAGGGGFIVGMALGGPIGAVIGGVVATAVSGATIETVDNHVRGGRDQKNGPD